MATLPDLVSLVLFLRAVDSSSLSKAAEQSNIALAAASRRISLLEHLYGVQLLYRSTKGVQPTPAGKALAEHARALLANAEKMQTALSDYAEGVKGHVRIQANTSAITQFLPGDLAATTNPDGGCPCTGAPQACRLSRPKQGCRNISRGNAH